MGSRTISLRRLSLLSAILLLGGITVALGQQPPIDNDLQNKLKELENTRKQLEKQLKDQEQARAKMQQEFDKQRAKMAEQIYEEIRKAFEADGKKLEADAIRKEFEARKKEFEAKFKEGMGEGTLPPVPGVPTVPGMAPPLGIGGAPGIGGMPGMPGMSGIPGGFFAPSASPMSKEQADLERMEAQLIRFLVDSQKDLSNNKNRAEIEKKVKELVVKSFDLRTQYQNKQLDLLSKQLEQIKTRVEKRNVDKDKLIEERVKELLSKKAVDFPGTGLPGGVMMPGGGGALPGSFGDGPGGMSSGGSPGFGGPLTPSAPRGFGPMGSSNGGVGPAQPNAFGGFGGSRSISANNAATIESLFASFDKDQDKVLSEEEIPTSIRKEVMKYDADKNGKINLAEYRTYAAKTSQQTFIRPGITSMTGSTGGTTIGLPEDLVSQWLKAENDAQRELIKTLYDGRIDILKTQIDNASKALERVEKLQSEGVISQGELDTAKLKLDELKKVLEVHDKIGKQFKSKPASR